MIKKKIEKAFNEQINAETHSAYLYWSMVAYFESLNLDGFATWMRVQVQEEMLHATKFFQHIADRQGRVVLTALAAPETQWKSPLAAFQAAYKHEGYITGRINKLMDLAQAESDHAAVAFLQWFVTEQVEEESNADGIVQKLKLIGDRPEALLLLDKELGARTFTPPPAGAAPAGA